MSEKRGEEYLLKFIERLKKKEPEQFDRAQRIIQLCDKYQACILQPIIYPEVRFKVENSQTVMFRI